MERRIGISTEHRFSTSYEVNPVSGCWEWLGACNSKGYGRMWLKPRVVQAHRYSLATYTGKALRKMSALHHCDNPRCVNPEHLFAGTQRDNVVDCYRKGRKLRAGKHPNARLEPGDIPVIKQLRANGFTYRAIAARYSMSVAAIYKICIDRAWTHIPRGAAAKSKF
jgi:hypothetical protein